jgi:hypothetical protein
MFPQFLVVHILDSPGSQIVGADLPQFAGLRQVHFGQVLIFNIAEVGLAVVDEFALDGLAVLLISDQASLVVLGAILSNHVGPWLPAGTGTLELASAGGGF